MVHSVFPSGSDRTHSGGVAPTECHIVKHARQAKRILQNICLKLIDDSKPMPLRSKESGTTAELKPVANVDTISCRSETNTSNIQKKNAVLDVSGNVAVFREVGARTARKRSRSDTEIMLMQSDHEVLTLKGTF